MEYSDSYGLYLRHKMRIYPPLCLYLILCSADATVAFSKRLRREHRSEQETPR